MSCGSSRTPAPLSARASSAPPSGWRGTRASRDLCSPLSPSSRTRKRRQPLLLRSPCSIRALPPLEVRSAKTRSSPSSRRCSRLRRRARRKAEQRARLGAIQAAYERYAEVQRRWGTSCSVPICGQPRRFRSREWAALAAEAIAALSLDERARGVFAYFVGPDAPLVSSLA